MTFNNELIITCSLKGIKPGTDRDAGESTSNGGAAGAQWETREKAAELSSLWFLIMKQNREDLH